MISTILNMVGLAYLYTDNPVESLSNILLPEQHHHSGQVYVDPSTRSLRDPEGR